MLALTLLLGGIYPPLHDAADDVYLLEVNQYCLAHSDEPFWQVIGWHVYANGQLHVAWSVPISSRGPFPVERSRGVEFTRDGRTVRAPKAIYTKTGADPDTLDARAWPLRERIGWR